MGSTFCFLPRDVAGFSPFAPAVLSLGSRGLRGFFSFGLSSTIGLPSGPVSFFFRCLLGFSGATPFVVDDVGAVVLLFVVCVVVLEV